MQGVDRCEADLAALLVRGVHGGGELRCEFLDDGVSVPDRCDHAFASVHIDELFDGGDSGGF